jgi:hypothetical protein
LNNNFSLNFSCLLNSPFHFSICFQSNLASTFLFSHSYNSISPTFILGKLYWRSCPLNKEKPPLTEFPLFSATQIGFFLILFAVPFPLCLLPFGLFPFQFVSNALLQWREKSSDNLAQAAFSHRFFCRFRIAKMRLFFLAHPSPNVQCGLLSLLPPSPFPFGASRASSQ